MKRKRRMIILAVVLLLFSLATIFYYPVTMEFQVPERQYIWGNVYCSEPNATGGVTMDQRELTAQEYIAISDMLTQVSLSRRLIDWKENYQEIFRYDINITPAVFEDGKTYIEELRLYDRGDGRYDSFLIVWKDGHNQTYRIWEKAVIKELIEQMSQ